MRRSVRIFTAVSPRIAGHVADVTVDTGQKVSRGKCSQRLILEITRSPWSKRKRPISRQWLGVAAGGTVNVTEQTGSAGIAQAQAGVSVAQGAVGAAQAQVGAAAGRRSGGDRRR